MALLTVVSLLTPLAAARGAAACGTKSGNFTTIAGPRFSAGGQGITEMAVDARTPSRVFVTNGTSVMRTSDGGCSWDSVFVLGPQPADGQTYTSANAEILDVVVPESGGRVLLSIAETVVNQTRPHVLVSFDAGRSWDPGTGLPPLGSPEALVVASSSPDIAYLAVDLGGGTLDTMFASADGGRTWQPRSQRLAAGMTGFVVDPIAPTELWGYGDGVHRSSDGGATWVPVDDFVGIAAGPVDVFHAGGRPSDIFAFVPEMRTVKRSQDGGENWLDNYGLSEPDSIEHGITPESRVATSAGKVYVWLPALFSWVDARAPVGGVTDLEATRAGSTSFYMHNASQIVVYEGQTGLDLDVPDKDFDIGDISLIDPDPAVVGGKPKLTPGSQVVKIPAGEDKRVRYGLTLSKIRTPLDLYFLVDTSESAKPFLRGLAFVLEDLVNELYSARLDVRFGLAEYRAYPDSTPPRQECGGTDVPVVEDPTCERNFVYHRVLDFPASTPQALATAIESLEPVAGGHYNAPLPALHQAATGSGVDVWPNGMSEAAADGNDVQPGQQASFREKALKVILNATDEDFDVEPYATDDFPPDVPTFDEVIAALNARATPDVPGIQQIGLALGTGALADLRRVASGTGAVAPDEGADCDGNGSAEIAPGAPLVCTVYRGTLEEGSNLVPAIVNMVEAVRNTSPVTLEVEAKDDRVVAEVTPDEYPGVVLQADHDLKFDVTYECPVSMAGEKTDVVLSTRQGADPLAKATATVVCGKVDPDKKKQFFDIFPFDRVFGLLPLLPLSPPPTLTNPSQATQAQSQAQAQGAMATQEQEQPQVAYAVQHKAALREALAKDEELRMTSYRDSSDPAPGLFLAAGAVMMSAAFALAMSRRRRAELALQRRR